MELHQPSPSASHPGAGGFLLISSTQCHRHSLMCPMGRCAGLLDPVESRTVVQRRAAGPAPSPVSSHDSPVLAVKLQAGAQLITCSEHLLTTGLSVVYTYESVLWVSWKSLRGRISCQKRSKLSSAGDVVTVGYGLGVVRSVKDGVNVGWGQVCSQGGGIIWIQLQ